MKLGRNDPCRCGSGKKYKKCHETADAAQASAELAAAKAKADAVLSALDEAGGPLSVAALEARVDLRRSPLELLLKVLAVDGLRYQRNPPAGELIRGRMTVMGKDPVGDAKGIVIAQHDLLDEAGRLVFSCLTRSLLARR